MIIGFICYYNLATLEIKSSQDPWFYMLLQSSNPWDQVMVTLFCLQYTPLLQAKTSRSFPLLKIQPTLKIISNQWSARVVFSISRREWEFLRFNLVHRDETENSWHLLSGFETRPRKNFLQSRASRRDRDLLSSLSDFETRTRIPLIWSRFSRRDREFWNLPSFPEIRLERPHYFACNFWEANYIKCRAPHFARCSPILKWPSHVLRASILW